MHATAAFSIVLSIVCLEALRRYNGLSSNTFSKMRLQRRVSMCAASLGTPFDRVLLGEALDRYAGALSFGYVLLLRTAWSIANAGFTPPSLIQPSPIQPSTHTRAHACTRAFPHRAHSREWAQHSPVQHSAPALLPVCHRPPRLAPATRQPRAHLRTRHYSAKRARKRGVASAPRTAKGKRCAAPRASAPRAPAPLTPRPSPPRRRRAGAPSWTPWWPSSPTGAPSGFPLQTLSAPAPCVQRTGAPPSAQTPSSPGAPSA